MAEDTEECTHQCSSCGVAECGDRTAAAAPAKLEPNKRSRIKKVIGVVSGKGGVGKSLVTSLLASAQGAQGGHPGRRRDGTVHAALLRHPCHGHR